MRMLFLTATRVPDVPSPLLAEVSELLRRRGHEVDDVIAERALIDISTLAPDYDLYLLKSHTELSLSIAAALDEQGARVLNPVAACTVAQDKLRCHRRLATAGVPVPRTRVTGSWSCASASLDQGVPIVVKPLRGHRGAGVQIVFASGQLRDQPAPPSPLLVQDFVDGPGEDLKAYVVGRRVWAVRKSFSPLSFTLPGHEVAVGPGLEDIALRAGAALGLGLYGLDVIEGPGGPVVVDLNYFPGYKGCSGVAGPMAAYIDAYARGEVGLDVLAADDLTGRPPSSMPTVKPVS